jgi:isoquinoline 1-oxidoreductase beta subunit
MTSTDTRRRFLQVGAAIGGGLLIGFQLGGCDKRVEPKPGLVWNSFIRIDRQGVVTLILHKAEMGQGTFTALPMLLAEELSVDLGKVLLEHAPALEGQFTGGSTSVRASWRPLREAGAAARTVLVAAAAKQWQVEPGSCRAANGTVSHPATGRALNYGQLVDAAARLPAPETVVLKKASEFTLIGRPLKRLDSADKVNGAAKFGIDVILPGMLVATVAASPVPGGKLATLSEADAMAVMGVRHVLRANGAVAVVGDHMWAARQGLAALRPQWDDGPNGAVTSAGVNAAMRQAFEKGEDGWHVDAVYEVPFLAHATMEPMNCTVDLRADGCDLWLGTQAPGLAQSAAARLTGLPLEKIKVHNCLLGGGFGRRLAVDYVEQALSFAKLMKGPVKFVWTREEDMQHDMYRPSYVDRIAARLDDKGRPAAWLHRIVGGDREDTVGARALQYAIPSMRVKYLHHETPLPTGFWRGKGATHNVFVVESFIDELAQLAQQDPVAYRRALLDKSPRMLAVLDLAAAQAGWGTPLKPMAGRRVGRGVSMQFVFGTYLAQVAEVSVGRDGGVRVHRVVCALDCGQVVNPDIVAAQMEGGIVFGLTAALWGEVTFANGRVVQSNFNDYRMMRIDEAPVVEVHIVRGGDEPGGIGEAGTSAIAPAVCNAVFAATGKRVRKLPIGAIKT